ncbi:hypothetical protein Tco_1552240, partial [Tanacetum coccineum]
DMTLDIASIRDVVLKTYFGTSWTLKDVREVEESFFHNVSEDKETAETTAGVTVGLHILEEEWQGKDTSLAHLKAVAQMKCDTAFRIQRVTRLSEAEILHLWTRFMDLENDSIVAEHRLSSKITQSPGGSLDMSEGSENSGSFEDSGRSYEDSKDEASSKRRL